MSAVACPPTGGCIFAGVGESDVGTAEVLIDQQAGSGWSATDIPLPNLAAVPGTVGVTAASCSSATSCAVVGNYDDSGGAPQGFVVTGGPAWVATELVPPIGPTPASDGRSARPATVDCPPSSTGCVVFGSYLDPYSHLELAAFVGAGTSWTATEVVLPVISTQLSTLDSIGGAACPTVTTCIVDGTAAVGTSTENFLAGGSGDSWGSLATPLPANAAGPTASDLAGPVGCTGPTECVAAVPYTDTSGVSQIALVSGSSGGQWSAIQAPLPIDAISSLAGPRTELASLACGASSCTAVGSYDRGGSTGIVVDQGLGTVWGSEGLDAGPQNAMPGGQSAGGRQLGCAASGPCLGLGTYEDYAGHTQADVLIPGIPWTESEATVVPAQGAVSDVGLPQTACSQSGQCVTAVTSGLGSAGDRPMMAWWSGESWTTSLPSLPADAAPDQSTADITGVSCSDDRWCVAVGTYVGAVAPEGLIVEGSGTTWSPVTAPVPSGTSPTYWAMSGVDCSSDASGEVCLAVGTDTLASGEHVPEAVTYENKAWSAAEVPLPPDADPSRGGALRGVSCPAWGSCVVTGTYHTTGGVLQEFADTQNGAGWSSVALPTASAPGPTTGEIACIGLTTCIVVGSGATTAAYVDDAGAWSPVAAVLPPDAASATSMASVSATACQNDGDCVFVGSYTTVSGHQAAFADSWNGSGWTASILPVASGPSTGWDSVTPSGIVCAYAYCAVAVRAGSSNGQLASFADTGLPSGWSSQSIAPSDSTGGVDAWAPSCVASATENYCMMSGVYRNSVGSMELMEATDLPMVHSVTPATGTVRGGGVVVVRGSGFVPDDQVVFVQTTPFGAYDASPAVTYVSPTELDAVVPAAGAPWSSDVMVWNDAVSSIAQLGDRYQYTFDGYVAASSDGGVFSFGDAPFRGSLGSTVLRAPIVGVAATSDGMGYWLVASDGGVFSFGDAPFRGSLGATRLRAPIVGVAANPNGMGYWLVASDGGVFSFGDAPFRGSLGATRLRAPIVGVVASQAYAGYWLVASDGGVFAFGGAVYRGSLGSTHLRAPIVGMASTPDGLGYWLVGADGGVFAFGDAGYRGSADASPPHAPIVGVSASPEGEGYWLVASDGSVYAFGDAVFRGSLAGVHVASPVVAIVGA